MYHSGQKYKPSAARENEIDRMLRDYRAGSGAFVRPDSRETPIGHILAKNETGSDLGFGRAAMYYWDKFRSGSGGSPDWDSRKDYVSLAPYANVISDPSPATDFYGGMAVTLEPIANTKFGRVAIAGLAIFAGGADADYPVYLAPFANAPYIRSTYWGFARVLADDPSNYTLVDLSDRKLTTQYVLTANMSQSNATATLGGGGSLHTWTTVVWDVHSLAGFQKIGDKGWCEYRGSQWVVTVPFC